MFSLFLTLTASSPMIAHEGHEGSAPQTSAQVTEPRSEISQIDSPTSPSVWQSLFSHPHNKVVHFPIALGVFAFLFFLIALRWTNFRPPAELLVVFGFLASGVAVLLGELQKSAFVGTPQESIMLTHERLGWATAIGFALWIFFMRWNRTRRWAWLIGLGIALLVSVTGFFGGQLAHTIGS